MTRTELTQLFRDLHRGVDPFRGESNPADCCLKQPHVRQVLNAALEQLAAGDSARELITTEEIRTLKRDLRALGYPATVSQVARVLTGSRTLADPRLRGLPAYRRYRGVLSRRAIVAALEAENATPAVADPDHQFPEDAIPEAVDFFTTATFDHLTDEKAKELGAEVTGLGLVKATDRLPEYMQRARRRYPRSFEPWSREERALLIEAMCYTNDADRLAAIFGRSASSVRREGQILIRNSREQRGDRSSKTASGC